MSLRKSAKFKNEIVNGNFVNTNNWTVNTGVVFSVANNVASFTVDGQYEGLENINFSAANGDKIYTRAKVKADTTSARVFVLYKSGSTVATKNHSGSNAFETLSAIGTMPETPASGYPKLKFDDIRASGWTQIQVKEAMAINLTAFFGAGKEPTVTQCDEMFANWFDGNMASGSMSRSFR